MVMDMLFWVVPFSILKLMVLTNGALDSLEEAVPDSEMGTETLTVGVSVSPTIHFPLCCTLTVGVFTTVTGEGLFSARTAFG
jgi:hypothetical protein